MTLSGNLLWEALIRFVTVGIYLSTAIVIFRLKPAAHRTAGSLAYLSKASHVVLHFPPFMLVAGAAGPAITLSATMGAALTWLFGVEIFSDQTRFDRRRLLPVLFVSLIVLAALVAPRRYWNMLWLLHAFTAVMLMSHLLFVLVSGWRNDLVDRRRFIATPVFVFSAIYSISLGFAETLKAFDHVPRQPSLFHAMVLLALSLIAIIVFGRFGGAIFGDEAEPVAMVQRRVRREPTAELSPKDAGLVTALDQLMQTEKLYRHENLRIHNLAERLGVPEHRLRHLLNFSLGYRNFSAYLSRWRIDEAKGALRDPDQADVPISTIAIDSGFQSLAPFNRAFKGETGMTPSEFRAEAAIGWSRTELRAPATQLDAA